MITATEILDRMTPGQPTTSREIARQLGEHVNPGAIGQVLRRMRDRGLVESDRSGGGRGSTWTRVDVPVQKREGVREAEVHKCNPGHSSGDRLRARVSVVKEPFPVPDEGPAPGSAAYYLLKAAERRAQG